MHIQLALFARVYLILSQCVVFGLHVFVFVGQPCHLLAQTLPANVQLALMADLLYYPVDADILIVFPLGGGVVEHLLQHSHLLVQLVALLVVFVAFVRSIAPLLSKQQLRLRYLTVDLRQFFTVVLQSKNRLSGQLSNHLAASLVVGVGREYAVGLTPHHHGAVFLLTKPLADVVVLHAEVLHLVANPVKVNSASVGEVHGVDDNILNNLTLKTLVKEYILYCARHVLVFGTLHYRESAQFAAHRLTIAVENVQILLPRADDVALEGAHANCLAYLSPLVTDIAGIVDEEPLVVRAVDEAERGAALREEGHNEESAVFACHLIDDVGVGVSEIEFVERLLPGHCAYAEFLLIGIVEKQNRAEDC